MVRKPGKNFENLSDEELLKAPVKLLSPEQRRRRRYLKKASTARGRKARIRAEKAKKSGAQILFCQGYTRKGEPCQAFAVKGAKHCSKHLNEAEKVKLGTTQENKGERVKPGSTVTKAPQLARLVMETVVDKLLSRYLAAIGMELIGFDEQNNPIVLDHGMEKGIRIHGESKDGYISMSNYPDLAAQIQVIEKLWDRTYGKPKQTQVLEGGEKPIHVQPVKSSDRAQQVADILHRAHAVPRAPTHEGRRRLQPSEPPATEVEERESNNVVPLNDA